MWLLRGSALATTDRMLFDSRSAWEYDIEGVQFGLSCRVMYADSRKPCSLVMRISHVRCCSPATGLGYVGSRKQQCAMCMAV